MRVIYHFHQNGWFWGNRVLLQESCVQRKVTILHLTGGLSSYWRNQRYCSVYYVYSLRKNQDPAPRLHYCFLTDPPFLSIPFLPWFSQLSCSVVCDSLRPHGLQHVRPPCPSPTPGVYSNSFPLSQSFHPIILSSDIPFSCLWFFPVSGSFQMSQFFASGGQGTGVSASASVLPMNMQDWFPLWWTGWISLQSKGLSRVFSNTTVQKHQFFVSQLSL